MDATQLLTPIVGTFGVVMSVAPLIQVNRVVRRGSSDDIAIGPLYIVVIGTMLWLSYGLASGDPTLVVCNLVGTLVNAVVLTTVFRFRSHRRAAAEPVLEPVLAEA
jgi:uncharacterized protein with PQ loop repeat